MKKLLAILLLPLALLAQPTPPSVQSVSANTSTGALVSPTNFFSGNSVLINPMTTLGDAVYGGASGAITRLAGNTTSTKKFLAQTGTGSASAAPGWSVLVDGDIPSALTGKTYNGLTVTSTAATLTLASGKVLTASNTLTFTGTDGSTLNIGGGGTLGSAAFTAASAYEVPLTFSTGLTRTANTVTVNTSQNIATISNLTSNGLVTTSGSTGALSVTSLGTGVSTFLSAPTSANLAAALTDETGSGAAVFATSPLLTTPNIGVATATTINGNAITTSTGTLTLGTGKTFTASNTLTLAGTDSSTLNIGAGGTLGAGAFQPQTVLTGTAGQITVSNGGVGATTLSLPGTITQAETFSAITTISNTTQATISAGAFVVAGGVSVAKKGFISDDLEVWDGVNTGVHIDAQSGIVSALATGSDFIVINGKGTGSVDLNHGDGTGGTRFLNGLSTVVASVDSAGKINSTATTEATTGGAGALTIAGGFYAAKKIISASSITTGDPSSGTAMPWKLGSFVAAEPSGSTGYLQVDANGSAYQIPVGAVAAPYYQSAAAQTAAVSLTSLTVGASDASYIISCNVLVTASATHSFSAECAYTDEGNTARVVTFNVQQLGGTLITAITNVTGAGPYEGVPLHIRAKAATTVTIRTNSGGTYTSVTYNLRGAIEQIN